MQTRNILFEVRPIDRATGLTQAIRLSSIDADGRGTQLDGYEWLPLIVDWPLKTVTLASGSSVSGDVSYGQIGFSYQENRQWLDLEWLSAVASVWVGELGQPFSEYKLIFTGQCGPLTAENGSASIDLLGFDLALNENLLTSTYAGTGGVEGRPEMRGKLKPWCSGVCRFVEPVLIDPVYCVYQYHGYGPTDGVSAVYERALPLDLKATATTYNQLIGVELRPNEYAVCAELGLIRLGTDQVGKIAADVRGARSGASFPVTVGAIVTHLLSAASVTDVASLSHLTQPWCRYVRDQEIVGDLVREAMGHIGQYLWTDGAGTFRPGDFFAVAPAVVLDRNSGLLGTADDAPEAPVYEVRVGYDRCWSVHGQDDISQAIKSISDEQQAEKDRLDTVRDLAAAAKEEAEATTARLASIANDNILDRSEKLDLMREVQKYNSERLVIENQALSFSVTGQLYVYQERLTALTTYLGLLSPSWTDRTTDTPIVSADFMQVFADFYLAREELYAEMVDKARSWDNITGPGKPENGATVGAGPLDPVNDRPAQDVTEDIDKSRAELPSLVLPILQKPLDDVYAQIIKTSGIGFDITKALYDTNNAAISKVGTQVNELGQNVAYQVTVLTNRVRTEEVSSLARYNQLNQAITDGDGALAESITSLETEYNGNKAAVQVELQAHSTNLGTINSQYTVKTVGQTANGTPLIGGFGLVNNGATVDMAFLVNSFRIADPNNVDKPMFYIDQGKLKLSGDIYAGNANFESVSIGGDKLEPNAVTSIASFENDYNGWQLTSSGYNYLGGSDATTPNGAVRTGNSTNSVLILVIAVAERDGGNDDDLNTTIERRGPNGGVVNLIANEDVQVAVGRRTLAFMWVDTNVQPNTDYHYYFKQRSIGDGSPYWQRVSSMFLCHKR